MTVPSTGNVSSSLWLLATQCKINVLFSCVILRSVSVVPSSVGSQPQFYPQSSTLDVHATLSKGPPLQPVPFGRSMLNLIQKIDWESIWVVLMMCVSQPSLLDHAAFVRGDLREQRKMTSSQTCTLTSVRLIVACTFILMILNVIFVHFEGQLFLVFQRRCWERNLPKVTQLVQIIRFQIWWNTKLPEWRISQDHIQITWRACKRIGDSWEIPGPSSEPATGPEKDLERESTVNLLGSSSLPPAKFLF